MRLYPPLKINHSLKKESKPSLEELKIRQKKNFENELKTFLQTNDSLNIPTSANPKVSIILILFNQAPLTFRCLRSLSLESSVSFEVIIIDNHSTDETAEMIKRVSGAEYVFNDENLGFLKAVNQAAGMAAGEHLLLLNNDAALLPGTLSNAVSRIEQNEKFGAVGGKIILVDGSLQEAGSIIWQDGSCIGYGREQDPDAPEFQFLRTVDYCSGAFLLVRRRLFEALGGFDEDYAPAYYEESDFCLRLAKAGYQVIYDPCVEILHYEFGSSSTTGHALELQRRNRKKLVDKHREILRDKPKAGQSDILKSRDIGKYKGRVLFIEDRVPHDSFGAGYPRCKTIVNSLVELEMFVTFYPLQFPEEDWPATYETLPRQVEVMLGYGIEGLHGFLENRVDFYDYVLISRPHNMVFIKYLYDKYSDFFKNTTMIYDAEAIFSLREIRQHELLGDIHSPRKFQKQLDDELNLAKIAQKVITVSQDEASHFNRAGCKDVHVLSHTLQVKPTPAEFGERKGLLFVGSLDYDNSPNVDSIIWFVEEVMPEIEKISHQPLSLTVVGGAGSSQLQSLESDHLIVTGRVDCLTPYFNAAKVFVVPTRFAAGVPHKAHEAASHGLPMVTTGLIARQLGWEYNVDILFSDDPKEFAGHILQLYNDEILWKSLRENSMEKIIKQCSKEKFVKELNTIFTGKDDSRYTHEPNPV
ncbi:MAG: glycosyltransferase [Desulfobacterales bacterium]|nr:glycosyltransferase [Desulfobacterales bacterium]